MEDICNMPKKKLNPRTKKVEGAGERCEKNLSGLTRGGFLPPYFNLVGTKKSMRTEVTLHKSNSRRHEALRVQENEGVRDVPVRKIIRVRARKPTKWRITNTTILKRAFERGKAPEKHP